jgi:threonine synthase
MGLPIGTLVCASNKNRVLADFFATGVYDRRREFSVTSSPSMDILVSSNLERAVFEAAGRDPERCAFLMRSLAEDGHYALSTRERAWFGDFAADWVDEDATLGEIARVFAESGYLLDPHSAVASLAARRRREAGTGDSAGGNPMIICATASPFKFPAVCLAALDRPTGAPTAGVGATGSADSSAIAGAAACSADSGAIASAAATAGLTDLDLARFLSERSGLPLPPPIAALLDPASAFREIHTGVIDSADMESALLAFLKGS